MDGAQAPHPARYQGLSWDRRHQAWRVRMYFAGKQRHIGRYEDELTAAKAYDKAAVYLYGSSANTNFELLECLQDTTEVSDCILQAKANARPQAQVQVQQVPDQRAYIPAAQQLQQEVHHVPAAVVGDAVV